MFKGNKNAYDLSEKILQDHGREGWLVYRLDDNNRTTFTNPRQMCSDWYQVGALKLALKLSLFLLEAFYFDCKYKR